MMLIYIVLLSIIIGVGIMVIIRGFIARPNGFKAKDYPGRDAFMLRKTWDSDSPPPVDRPEQNAILDPYWLSKIISAIPDPRLMQVDDPPIMARFIPLIPEGDTPGLFKKLTEEAKEPKPVLRAFDFKEA